MKKQSDKNMQIGMEWSNVTLSCAYDCLFTILRNVYNHNNQQWNERVNEANRFMNMLTTGWQSEDQVHEVTQDKIQKLLHILDPEAFTMGDGTDLFALCRIILLYNTYVLKHNYVCYECNDLFKSEDQIFAWWYLNSTKPSQISKLLKTEWEDKIHHRYRCTSCNGQIIMTTHVNDQHPPNLSFSIGNINVKITASLSLKINQTSVKYRLCGVIYHGGFHFTAQLLDKAMNTYYYDGMTTGINCDYEGKFNSIENMYEAKGRSVSTLIYTTL